MRTEHGVEEVPAGGGKRAVALFLAPPIIFLLEQALVYGFVQHSCKRQSELLLHVFTLIALLLIVAVGLLSGTAGTLAERSFLRRNARGSAVLSGLGVLVIWAAILILNPCGTW